MSKTSSQSRKLLALSVCWLLAALTSSAATYTWTGTGFFGQDFLWSNPFNWQGNVAPQAGEANVTLVFPNSAAPRKSTNDIQGLTVASIQFHGTNYSIQGSPSGNALTLEGGGFVGWSISATANGCHFGSTCPLALENSGVVSVATNCTISVLSSMSGRAGLTKTGPGTLKFSAAEANTYAGTTTVSDGTLDLGSGVLFPTVTTYVSVAGPLVIGGTNLNFSPTVRLLLDDQIADTASVTVNANGELDLNGNDETLGSLLLAGGLVRTAEGATVGTLTLKGNVTATFSPVADFSQIWGLVNLGTSTREFNVGTNAELRVYAEIWGSPILNPGLTKTGEGKLFLSSDDNSYPGPTLILEGMLLAGAPLGATNAGTTVNGGQLVLIDDVHIGNEALTLNAGAPGKSPLVSNPGSNSWAGPITLNGSCWVSVQQWVGLKDDLNLSGPISGSGALRKTGYGDLYLSGFGGNTFTGDLYAGNGRIFLNKSASAPAFGGSLEIDHLSEVSLLQINQIPNNAHITIYYGTLRAAPGVTDTVGSFEFWGALLTGGTFTLNGNVTNHFESGESGESVIQSDLVLPAMRTFHCDLVATLVVTGLVHGVGGITVTGPGTCDLLSTNTYSGVTHVTDGLLRLTGPGRPGNSVGNTVVESGGRLHLFYCSVTNETVVLRGTNYNDRIWSSTGTNRWKGPVVLDGGAALAAIHPLTLDGPISGHGGISFTHLFGPPTGIYELTGNTDNTFEGPAYLQAGTLLLNKSGADAIPGDLIVGRPTNGEPAALVRAQSPYQFRTSASASVITVNPSGSLECEYDQTIANLTLRDGSVDATGQRLALLRDLVVEPVASGHSYFHGRMILLYGNGGQHLFDVRSNCVMWLLGDIDEDPFTQHLTKDGTGTLIMNGSNTFAGTFTIENGTVIAGGAQPLGTVTGPTAVHHGATLAPAGILSAEPLALAGWGYTNGGALVVAGTNMFTGPVTLHATTMIDTRSNAVVTFTGAISGAGGLVKRGAGTLQLTGTSGNTYAGSTVVYGGALELGKTNGAAVPGALSIVGTNSGSYARLLRAGQIGDSSPVMLIETGWIALDGHNETVGSLEGQGAIFQSGAQTGSLTVGGNGDSTTFSGLIHGGGGLTKTGTGTLTLTGNNPYTGTTTVNGGKLIVSGQQPQSPVSLLTGGSIGGTGRVGHISDLNGNIAPGMSPGILVCSNYSTFSPANQLQIEINGSAPGSGYDQLQVKGAVLLMGGTVQVAMNFTGAVSNRYVIISNDGVDPVSGTFTGLPEGATLTSGAVTFAITYQGGDGNDVALVQKTLATGPQIGAVQKLADGKIQISATGLPNTTYQVEATASLNPPIVWSGLGDVTSDGAGLLQFIDADASQFMMRFYRFALP